MCAGGCQGPAWGLEIVGVEGVLQWVRDEREIWPYQRLLTGARLPAVSKVYPDPGVSQRRRFEVGTCPGLHTMKRMLLMCVSATGQTE